MNSVSLMDPDKLLPVKVDQSARSFFFRDLNSGPFKFYLFGSGYIAVRLKSGLKCCLLSKNAPGLRPFKILSCSTELVARTDYERLVAAGEEDQYALLLIHLSFNE